MSVDKPQLSVVVPVHNEAAGIAVFHKQLLAVLEGLHTLFEVIYVDDGSTDRTATLLHDFAKTQTVRVLCLTRNFGKEIALTAGLHEARGAAVIMIDGDGQHPVEVIPEFVAAWQQGALVVVGRRTKRRGALTKRAGSKLFYGLFNRALGLHADPDSSDFRLIDRSVCDQFKELSEHNRMTRSLIDWFGYDRVTISYSEHTRMAGSSPYTLGKLMKLAVDGAISHSTSPLYIAAYAGAGIMAFASLVGVVMTGNYFLNDPIGLHATASAYGLVLVLFLIGLLLISQGIIGLYLSHIHAETQNRPLYVVDKKRSRL